MRADVSTRHLSCVETGRAKPSRDLVLHLARHLDVPLRDRNSLLVAAGFAPQYVDQPLDDPRRAKVRAAIELVLHAHEPWPAIVVDRHWNLVHANRAAGLLVEGVAPHLLGPPTNVLRACLHPEGLAARIVNLGAMCDHVLGGLRRQIDATGDPTLIALAAELASYVAAARNTDPACHMDDVRADGVAVTMRLQRGDDELSLVSMLATFGTSVDAALSELTLETFLPADDHTAAVLRSLAPTT